MGSHNRSENSARNLHRESRPPNNYYRLSIDKGLEKNDSSSNLNNRRKKCFLIKLLASVFCCSTPKRRRSRPIRRLGTNILKSLKEIEETASMPRKLIVIEFENVLIKLEILRANSNLNKARFFEKFEYAIGVKVGKENLVVGVNKRPFLNEFLSELSKCYKLVIWSSLRKKIGLKIANIIDPDGIYFDRMLFNENCIRSKDKLYKPLNLLSEYNVFNTIMVSVGFPHNYKTDYMNIPQNDRDNTLVVSIFDGDQDDVELLSLKGFFISIRKKHKVTPIPFLKHKYEMLLVDTTNNHLGNLVDGVNQIRFYHKPIDDKNEQFFVMDDTDIHIANRSDINHPLELKTMQFSVERNRYRYKTVGSMSNFSRGVDKDKYSNRKFTYLAPEVEHVSDTLLIVNKPIFPFDNKGSSSLSNNEHDNNLVIDSSNNNGVVRKSIFCNLNEKDKNYSSSVQHNFHISSFSEDLNSSSQSSSQRVSTKTLELESQIYSGRLKDQTESTTDKLPAIYDDNYHTLGLHLQNYKIPVKKGFPV